MSATPSAPTIVSRRQASPFLAMSIGGRAAVCAALIGLWAIAAFASPFQSAFQSSLLVVLALGAVIGLRLLPLIFYREEYGWFHPLIFGALMMLPTLPRSMPVYIWGLPNHAALPGWSGEALTRLVALELLVGVVGLLAYYIGYFWLPAPRAPRFSVARFGNPAPRALAIVGVSLISFMVFIQRQGGIFNHLLSWQLGRRSALGGEYYWTVLIGLGGIACLIWLASSRQAVTNPAFWAAAATALAIRFLTTGSRSSVVFLIGTGLIIWMLRRRRIAAFRVLAAGLIAVLLMGSLGTVRRSIQRSGGEVDWSVIADIPAVIEGSVSEMRDRAGSQATSFAVFAKVPEEVPLLYGESYWSFLVKPIPRALWPGKPVTVEAMAGETFWGADHGTPIGANAEAYWNFGWLGVVVVYLVFGVFHRWLAAAYERNATVPGAAALFVLLLFYVTPSSPGLFQGTLMTVSGLVVLRMMARVKFGGARPASATAIESGMN